MLEGLSALRRRFGASLVDRSSGRRRAAWVLSIFGPAIVALGLLPFRSSVGLAGFLFVAELAVVAVAVLGGLWPVLASATVAILLGAYFYAAPYGTLIFEVGTDVGADAAAFIAFVVVGAVVGFVVDEFARLAKEQAALRRVATLVAHAATADELFSVVTEEVGRQLGVDFVRMARYEFDHTITFVAASGTPDDAFGVGTNRKIEEKSVSGMVLRTGGAARIDNYGEVRGPLGKIAQTLGMRSAVGVPIIVEGRLWGMMLLGSPARFPADTEARLGSFTDLLSTAIANAESRAELAASRARVVAAADETRRRIERDLHDGTQQRLVSLAIELRAAEAKTPADLADHRAILSHAADGLTDAVGDLQELSRGIHPAILSKGGLGPAVKTLARRSAVAVELDLQVDGRLPQKVEVAAYYIVAEALTNVDKYARASLVHVTVQASDEVIELAVRDDGIGGADPTRGSGLIGLMDRVEALGGTLTVAGSLGEGTSLLARIPIDRNVAEDAGRPWASQRAPIVTRTGSD
jgi:signal transduction histidine kinase